MTNTGEVTESFFAKGTWLMGILCALVFLATITTGRNVFDNAWLIFNYEAVFVVLFLVHKVASKNLGALFPVRSVGFWLLACWFVSITVSLMFSPYGLMVEWFAVQRYFQTLFHVLFFLSVYMFLNKYNGSMKPLFISLAASIAMLAGLFLESWHALPESLPDDSREWFRHPPYNAHIRITGFLVAAGTVALQPLFAAKTERWYSTAAYYVIGLASWGLMFWTGGRGAIISAYFACVVVGLILLTKGQPWKHYLGSLAVFTIGGILLAELFEVFYWNGVLQAVERTAEATAAGDPYKLTTGRTTLCGWVVESLSLNSSWFFGLGSQGYCFMPNRTFGFQPHNLIFQFLAEWGILGTSLFMSMIGYGFFKPIKERFSKGSAKISIAQLSALAVILSLGVHSLVDGIFYHAQPSMHLAIAFAVWMKVSSDRS